METIKLKILDEAGHTLMTCDADTAVSLVYTNCYKPGDRVAGEIRSGALSGKPGVLQYRAEYAGLYRHL